MYSLVEGTAPPQSLSTRCIGKNNNSSSKWLKPNHVQLYIKNGCRTRFESLAKTSHADIPLFFPCKIWKNCRIFRWDYLEVRWLSFM